MTATRTLSDIDGMIERGEIRDVTIARSFLTPSRRFVGIYYGEKTSYVQGGGLTLDEAFADAVSKMKPVARPAPRPVETIDDLEDLLG